MLVPGEEGEEGGALEEAGSGMALEEEQSPGRKGLWMGSPRVTLGKWVGKGGVWEHFGKSGSQAGSLKGKRHRLPFTFPGEQASSRADWMRSLSLS